MVNVKEQQRFSIIIPERKITSIECPYVFYPINICGCNHPSNRLVGDYKECSPDICPFTNPKDNPYYQEWLALRKDRILRKCSSISVPNFKNWIIDKAFDLTNPKDKEER